MSACCATRTISMRTSPEAWNGTRTSTVPGIQPGEVRDGGGRPYIRTRQSFSSGNDRTAGGRRNVAGQPVSYRRRRARPAVDRVPGRESPNETRWYSPRESGSQTVAGRLTHEGRRTWFQQAPSSSDGVVLPAMVTILRGCYQSVEGRRSRYWAVQRTGCSLRRWPEKVACSVMALAGPPRPKATSDWRADLFLAARD